MVCEVPYYANGEVLRYSRWNNFCFKST